MKKEGIQTRKRKPKSANADGKSSKSSSKMSAAAAAAAAHEAMDSKRMMPMYSTMITADHNIAAYGMQVRRASPDKGLGCASGVLPAYAPTAVIKHEVSSMPESPGGMNVDMMGNAVGESHSPRSLSSPIAPSSAALNKHLHGLRMSPLDVQPVTSSPLLMTGDMQSANVYQTPTSVLVQVDQSKMQQGNPSTIIQHHHSS
ncbi:hypothetical protein HPB49_022436 [Dermacentor silvarum]|uniref:Uncharacterized protein n=2 Tax=Dermacentor silvarum TaxID=543639 RepID=A0ACB8CBM7_DERSI|nr:hypothetical protein HPB49_022436 [Dermacentor silvarum]